MQIKIRADGVEVDGYVNAVGRDSRPMRDKKTGKRFVEQVVPGVFKRALEKNEVQLLLNHEENRNLGSTVTNLKLYEDAIGLRASAVITDEEVIQKAKDKKLRGWSFGFFEKDASEEEMPNGMTRRFLEEIDLVEVSIIDDRKVPCYRGTSIETRAEGNELLTAEIIDVRATYEEVSEHIDYTTYKQRIKKLEETK